MASKNINHNEIIAVRSFLQLDLVDFRSCDHAAARKLSEYRMLESLRKLGLKESIAFDCFSHYEVKARSRSYHGAYRKVFCLNESFSLDLTGSSNSEYPLRFNLVVNYGSEWFNSVCLGELYCLKIGNLKLENVPSQSIFDAVAVKCRDLSYDLLNGMDQFPMPSYTRNFRRWLKGN